MAQNNDLSRLAQELVKKGPYKTEQATRRVRGLYNGKYVFDSLQPQYVWEIADYYPHYYIPTSSFTTDATLTKLDAVDGTNGTAHFGRLTVGNRSTDRIIIFNTDVLKNLVKVEFRALDQWFEEEVPIFVHPKDPYKRVDILQSFRTVRVELDGVLLAETSNALFLHETNLPVRYYLPPTSVKWENLTPSSLETSCPYKGKANYYHVNVNGQQHQHLVWYYQYPTIESAPIAGHLCFYNDRVDIWVDGVKEKKPAPMKL